jgi:hypothetical protein
LRAIISSLLIADVAKAGINPALYYFLHGAREGRDPSAEFDTSFYLEAHPEVVTSGIDPLVRIRLTNRMPAPSLVKRMSSPSEAASASDFSAMPSTSGIRSEAALHGILTAFVVGVNTGKRDQAG